MKVSIDFGLVKVPETGVVIQPGYAISLDLGSVIIQGIALAIYQMGREVENIIEVITVAPSLGNCADFKVVFAVGNDSLPDKKTRFEGFCSHCFGYSSENNVEEVRSKLINAVERALSAKMAKYHASHEFFSHLLSRVHQSH